MQLANRFGIHLEDDNDNFWKDTETLLKDERVERGDPSFKVEKFLIDVLENRISLNQFDFWFSKILKSDQVEYNGMIVKAKSDCKGSSALLEPNLDKHSSTSWKIKVTSHSSWLGFGIAIKDIIISKKFNF